jgi:Zn-dependent membrane protease YugP
MSHKDRNWLDVYRAAAMEFDRNKLPASIDVAERAIHQRLRGLPIAQSKEHRKLRDVLNSLAVLKRML